MPNPRPCTLHPTPYTLHPTPDTVSPKPSLASIDGCRRKATDVICGGAGDREASNLIVAQPFRHRPDTFPLASRCGDTRPRTMPMRNTRTRRLVCTRTCSHACPSTRPSAFQASRTSAPKRARTRTRTRTHALARLRTHMAGGRCINRRGRLLLRARAETKGVALRITRAELAWPVLVRPSRLRRQLPSQ